MNHLKTMTLLLIASFSVLSCGKVYNSSSADYAKYGGTVSGSENFRAARVIMVEQCFSCHSDWGDYTESLYISNGLVSAGSLSGSLLYTKLRDNIINSSTGTMPPSGPLSAEEIATIATWISGI